MASPSFFPTPADAGASYEIRGACPHDCPDTCALLTTVQVGVAIKVQGNPRHRPTDGVGLDDLFTGVHVRRPYRRAQPGPASGKVRRRLDPPVRRGGTSR